MNDDELFLDPPEMQMVDAEIDDIEAAEDDLINGLKEFEIEGQMIPDQVVDSEKDNTNYEEYMEDETND